MRTQKIETDKPISYIVGRCKYGMYTMLPIISPDIFEEYEANPLYEDYCSIVGDTLYISSKSKLLEVNIHYYELDKKDYYEYRKMDNI